MAESRILIVEDEIIVALAIQEMLKSRGYDVGAIASTGQEAIEKAERLGPDLVLMDIVLKGDMDGIAAAEQIRSRFDIPVVYLTAYTDSETVRRAKITEPFGYITKPFDEKQLHTIIEMALYKHKMDKALRESESEKQLILGTLSELIVYLDKNLRIVWANKAASDSVGQPAEKLVGRRCYEVWHGRREPCLNCPVVKTIETKRPQTGETTSSDGRIWDIRAYPVLNKAGEVTGVVEATLDITQRKRARMQLERQTAVVNGINRVLRESLICETEGEVAETCLAVAEELTGSKFGFIGELTGADRFNTTAISDTGWARCKMPKSDALLMIKDMEVRGIWGMALKDDRSVIVNNLKSHPDSIGTLPGHPKITSFLGVPLRHDGEIFGIIGLANKKSGYDLADQQDIEALSVAFVEALMRKRAEQALCQEKDKAQRYLDIAGVMLVAIDTEGKVTLINKKGCELLDYEEAEITGKNWFAKFLPERIRDEVKSVHEKILTGKIQLVRYYENPVLTKTGDERIIAWHNSVLKDDKGNVIGSLSSGEDITERKKAELRLIDYQAQLRSLAVERLRIEEAERRRLARAVHDNIGQELALAKMELQSSMQSTMGLEAMGILDKVCKVLDKVMEDVHSLTFELSSPVLYEVGLVAAVEQWLAEEIRQKHGIRYKLTTKVKSKDLDHELSATVFRVVRELLVNVIKHARAKNVRVGIKELKGALSVAIEDDGVGFNVAKFAKALRKGKKDKFGLFSAKEQLEFLGGKFRIESVSNKGTKVSMTVPLKR